MSRSHRFWGVLPLLLILILSISGYILSTLGYIGTWHEGFLYQLKSPKYTQSQAEVPGSYSLELDLKDLESNADKVIYEDDAGCRITVDQVDENQPGEYRVFFRAHSSCDASGGQLVTGTTEEPQPDGSTAAIPTAVLTASAGKASQTCSWAGYGGLADGNSLQFGFHLLPQRDPDLAAAMAGNENHVTVPLDHLTRLTTRRIP